MRTPTIRSGPAAIATAAVLLATLRLLAPPPARPATTGSEPARSPVAAATPEAAAMQDLRNVGTAMYSWYMDQAPRSHKTGKATVPAAEDVTKVPVITRAALEKLLVPRYIKAIPENDPWGHAYEYRLSQDPDADEAMAIRSAGAGSGATFTGDVYHVGAIAPADTARNLVWKDGYFVRWAEAVGKQ
jgi:hypothetical protein